MTFLIPFFFLLLDSFFLSLSSLFCELSLPDAEEPAVAGCSPPEPVPAAAALAAPASGVEAGAVGAVPAPEAGSVVAGWPVGALPDASGGVDGAVVPAGAAASLGGSAVPLAPPTFSAGAAPPGVTVSTTAEFLAPPSCDRLPPFNTSVADVVSLSGSNVGAPLLADAIISSWGPERTSASGFFMKPS